MGQAWEKARMREGEEHVQNEAADDRCLSDKTAVRAEEFDRHEDNSHTQVRPRQWTAALHIFTELLPVAALTNKHNPQTLLEPVFKVTMLGPPSQRFSDQHLSYTELTSPHVSLSRRGHWGFHLLLLLRSKQTDGGNPTLSAPGQF